MAFFMGEARRNMFRMIPYPAEKPFPGNVPAGGRHGRAPLRRDMGERRLIISGQRVIIRKFKPTLGAEYA